MGVLTDREAAGRVRQQMHHDRKGGINEGVTFVETRPMFAVATVRISSER